MRISDWSSDVCSSDLLPVYDLAGSLASPRYRWLVWLDALALLFTIGGALGWVAFARAFDPAGVARDALLWASLAVALLVVDRFCFSAAHVLWLRFDFLSEIIWVEMSGNYQAAAFEFGAQFTDRVKSKRQVINEIGSASCRERVCQYVKISVVAGSLQKKK